MAGKADRGVRAAATRVALIATAIVAAGYLLIGVAVLVIVNHNLTQSIDDRLSVSLGRLAQEGHLDPGFGRGYGPPAGETPYSDPLLIWTVFPNGAVYTNVSGAHLPATALHTTQPTDLTLNGAEVRITGRQVNDVFVVIGQTTESVSKARSNLMVAEIIVAPLLLLAVFVGTRTVGRRVAAPIERARQRQVDFTADASHELRTPLAVIEAQASLATEGERDLAWYQNALRRIDGESKRMRRLVDDMLWLARFDAAGSLPAGELVDLAILAQVAADRFTGVAESRRLTLTAQISAASAIVAAPAEWLDRLLGVLLDNACRYTPEGGHVRLSVADDGERLRVSVDDSGPGIPEPERAQIFDRFRRASDVAGGAGLGLAIADAIVRATGGRWRVEGSDLGGAGMTVTWPHQAIGRAAGAPGEVTPGVPSPQVS
jgi:signal transduction histidine kinase